MPAFLGVDKVIVIVHSLVKLNPGNPAIELTGGSGVVFRYSTMTVNADTSQLPAMSQQLRHSNLATTQKHYAATERSAVKAKLQDAWKSNAVNIENPVISSKARCEISGPIGI